MDKEGDTNCGNTQEEKSLTQRQKEYVAAYRRLGSARQVALEMGVCPSVAQDQLVRSAKKLGYERTEDLATTTTPRTQRTKKGKATAQELLRLIKDQEYRCQLSGVVLEPYMAALDHKMPVSSGGSDALENLQWVSAAVNKAKGSMGQDEFITMCKRVASWNS
jgi:5-methylcytosine-specific restriction endonuclease McrA